MDGVSGEDAGETKMIVEDHQMTSVNNDDNWRRTFLADIAGCQGGPLSGRAPPVGFSAYLIILFRSYLLTTTSLLLHLQKIARKTFLAFISAILVSYEDSG